jgi:putative salt-induced outer membrane protein YdiY
VKDTLVNCILKKLLGSIVALFVSCSAHAIVNIERAIIGPATDGFHTRLDLLATGASGNTVNQRSKVDLLTLWQQEENTEFLQLQYAYGSSQGVVDTDNAFAHLRHRTEVDPNWGVEVFAQISRDSFARLTQRTLLGGGVRWVLIEENKNTAAYFGLGSFHEVETRTDVIGTTDQTDVELWRGNLYLVLKYRLNDQVRIINNTYYQPALNDSRNFRLLEQASLLVKIDEHLDLKMSLEYTFDSIPPQTVQQRDVTYSTGLTFSF